MMRRYEALILSTPEITQDEAKSIETEISRIVAEYKGIVISFERWGKYKLSYPVDKHDYGVYYLTRFEIPLQSVGNALEAVKTVCAVKLHTIIMRHVICALDLRRPLTYQRPRSLEETPVETDIDGTGKEGRQESGSYNRDRGSYTREPRERRSYSPRNDRNDSSAHTDTSAE